MVQLFWWKILFLETPIPNFFRTNTRSRRRSFVGVRRVECISLISATWQTHWHISPCCSLAFAFRPLFLFSGIGKAHRWSRSKLYIVFNTLNEGPPQPAFLSLSGERGAMGKVLTWCDGNWSNSCESLLKISPKSKTFLLFFFAAVRKSERTMDKLLKQQVAMKRTHLERETNLAGSFWTNITVRSGGSRKKGSQSNDVSFSI